MKCCARTTFGVFLALALGSGCIIVTDKDDLGPRDSEIEVGCWAIGVTDFSTASLPMSNDFAPTKATGIADVPGWVPPTCVDHPDAWSPSTESAGHEFIDLIYAVDLRIDRVRIFENFGAGASDVVTLINTGVAVPDVTVPVPADLQGAGQPCDVLSLDVDAGNGSEWTLDRYDKVALDLDTTLVPGFNEIDAVQIVGLLDTDFQTVPGSCEVL